MITPSFSPTATERVLPKLALDFTTASLDSRVTFTRTTDATHPATYVNSSGVVTSATNNQPRFDYDPITFACKGLLIEESRENKYINSEDFSAWTLTESIISTNAITAPNSTLTADKFIQSTVNGYHSISQNFTPVAGTTYSMSIWAKAGEYFGFQVYGNNSTTGDWSATLFNLSTGQFVINTHNATAQAFSNGWYRITTKHYCPSTSLLANIYVMQGAASQAETGDGTSGIYIWGAQLEAGAFATSYIPTTTTALTRNADVATMTGTNFSDWYNATQGTFNCKADVYNYASVTQRLLQVSDGTLNNRMEMYLGPTGEGRAVVVSNTVSYGVSSTVNLVTINNPFVLCYSYVTNNCELALNAGDLINDSTVTLPISPDQLRIGYSTAAGYLSGHIQKINYWSQRVTNNEVQAFSK